MRTLLLSLGMAFIYGCSAAHGPVEPITPQYDKWGCSIPAQVIALNNQGFNLESLSIREFAIGKVDYKSNPDLRLLLEKEATNSLVAEYLLCNAKGRGDIDKNKPEQIQYLRNFFHFIQSGPTPDQISDYPKQHSFPVSSPGVKTSKTSLSISCHYGFMPERSHDRIYTLSLFPTPKEAGGGGFVEHFSLSGEFQWPTKNGLKMTGYACELMNGGNVSIFNIEMVFDLTFMEVVKSQTGSLQSGKVTLARPYLARVDRIDPGPSSAFNFYIFNQSSQFVEVLLPKAAAFVIAESTERQSSKIIQPEIRLVFEPLKG